MKNSFYLLLIFIIIAAQSYLSAQAVVKSKFGFMEGNYSGGIFEFLGVPFAKPPVGDLRWKPPLDPVSWTDTLKVQAFKQGCLQKDFVQGDTTYTISGSEDCLYLNIWTPDTVSKTLPVLVFVHGGGNQQGAADEISAGTEIYYGRNLAERGHAVVVTIDYRLGPFGFLVHPGLDLESANHVSGNYGLLDQIKALEWVRGNISYFGGDTSKVMVFGQSAGGVDIGDLILSPLAAGLFQRACIESAVPSAGDYSSNEEKGIKFVNQFISTGTDSEKIDYMRKLPADSLIKYLTNALIGGIVQQVWQPVIDNYVLPGSPFHVLGSGNFNKVPLIIGSNADEMSLSAPQVVYPLMVTALINSSVPSSYSSQGLQLYPPGNNTTEARDSYVQILTDGQFTAPVRRIARLVADNQGEPVWRYFLTYAQQPGILNPYGSYHGIELFYVFNTWENAPLGSGRLFTAEDDSMESNMLKYWINFANSGNPNGQGLVNWPQYNSTTDTYLEINATPDGSLSGVRTAKCDFWDQAVGYVTEVSDKTDTKHVSYFSLSQNYPNPFNPNTTISYAIPENGFVSIKIYDLLGNEVKTLVNGYKEAGMHSINFEGGRLASGIYFYRMQAGNFVKTKKFILMK